jgi:hypothetical protein
MATVGTTCTFVFTTSTQLGNSGTPLVTVTSTSAPFQSLTSESMTKLSDWAMGVLVQTSGMGPFLIN